MRPEEAWFGSGAAPRLNPAYAFVGFDARRVGFNRFLDVRPSELAHRRREFVWDFVSGLTLPALAWRGSYTEPTTGTRKTITKVCFPSLTWRVVRRRREFDGQPKAFWFGFFNLVWAPGACAQGS